MERIRDGRRGNSSAVNGLSRRRPRSGSLRDSPEEDGGAEMLETSRFRDRGGRKDRDRDRSTRSKRRRGDRLLHGSNREGEDSTDESLDEEEEDDGEDSVQAVRLPPPPFSHPSPPPVTLPTNHNPRKIFPSNVMRPPAVWKAADEMIGVPVPRKARSAHAKRPHECLPSSSGGAGGGSGEQMHRQASTSPSRSSQTSAAAAPPPTPISPVSSSAPIRRKTKQITSGKQRPPKISKSSSSIQEIEIEVAEVLYGLTRQFQDPSKTEAQTLDSKEANGSCNETKSRASSPSCFSPPRAASQSQPSVLPHVPKRKRPRAVKYEDESPASHSYRPGVAANASVSSTSKASEGGEKPKMDIPSPKSEKTASSPAENGSFPLDSRSHLPEEPKREEIAAAELETSVHSKEPAREFDGNDVAATTIKPVPEDDRDLSREKFQIDLMAPPPGKISPEMESDFVVEDSEPSARDVERMTKAEFLKTEEPGRNERAVKPETRREDSSEKSEKISPHPDAPLDGERGDKVRIGGSKQAALRPQQSKVMKPESRPDRAGQSGPLPHPMSVAGWPAGLPFGYMGQVPSLPAIVPVDGSAAAAKALQQLRPRRCATHCYIAQNIYYQQLTRMNPFWPAKPYNLNMMPAADHVFPARLQDSKALPVAPVVGAIPVSKEKSSGLADTAQRKQQQQQQIVLQQPLQPGAASNNILPAPAFIFPINQPQGAAASAPANRAAAVPSDSSAAPASAGAFNYGNLTQGEAQYLVLQNHGYPFPIPTHVGTTPYRGATQALPFFNGSLYASQILHPSQLHQQQPPQGHQNASNSTGSSSSQKHSQKADPVETPPPQKHSQQRPPPHLLPHQARQMEGENGGGGDSPSSVDSRISHKGGGLYGHNFVMPLHPQNFALMALGGDKSQQQQQLHAPSQQQGMKVELAPSQAFAMSFASFNGAVAAAAAAGQAHALDFSSTAQNHAIFQSLPEAARHAYQAQQKKSQHQPLPDKSFAESMNSAGEDARKAILAGKASSRRNSIDGSSTRVMNVMNGSARTAPSRSDAAAPPASSSSSTPHQQRQQHLLHLQKQHQQHHHQQQLQMHQHQQLASRAAKASGAGNSTAYSDRIPGGAAMSKLPNALSGVPQALLQANNGPVGSPQWKNNANPRTSSAGGLPSPPSQIPSNPPAAVKSNHQGRTAPSPQSQQISFGIRPTGAAAAAGAPAAPPVASPTSSVAKTMSGSPRASPTAAKMAAPSGSASQAAHQPKGPVPGAHGRSNGKSSSPSILGQPHLATSSGAGMKQPQQQSQKQQAFPPQHILFANSYLQQQHQQQPPHSLTLGGGAATTTSDPPVKTAPPPNSGMKGIPFISGGGFPYFHGMSSVPVKPAEQKPAAGS